MSIVPTEHVLVVPTQVLNELGYFQGFTPDVDRYLDRLFHTEHTSYRPRGEMEQNPDFKQLIPYVIFRYTDPDGQISLFCYTRGTGQGEQRLHRKRSIGIGGHISTEDAGQTDPYDQGMRRELEEEVWIDTPYRAACLGLINDDQTEVGRVHLGVVHVFDVDQPLVRPRESDIIQAGFVPLCELQSDLDRFESWSRICLESLFRESMR
ncbi:MAG: phosphoesterase [Planctomycetaceae bacterium]|nr:MAG: phosphoesterase [Planctomycetaceae bacterium]